VWYAVIVPPSGAISFTTREGSITDAGMPGAASFKDRP